MDLIFVRDKAGQEAGGCVHKVSHLCAATSDAEELVSNDCAFGMGMQFGGSVGEGSYIFEGWDFFSLVVQRVHYLGFLDPNPTIEAMGDRTGWTYWVDFEGALYDFPRKCAAISGIISDGSTGDVSYVVWCAFTFVVYKRHDIGGPVYELKTVVDIGTGHSKVIQ